jgi:uncharacterized protein YvpB
MKTTKYIIIILILSMLVVSTVLYIKKQHAVTPINTDTSVRPNEQIDRNIAYDKSEIKNLKSSILLSVPFTPQAPTANWDELHNEACEEAVAIMAYEYFSENTSTTLDPKQVEAQIGLLTDWQQQNLGYNLSITTEETANMIESVYKLKTKIINNFTETDIKQAISQNQLVVLPANGRLLNNPYFKSPGPIYHMLLITGYDEQDFITNDPGTKRGQNYRYSFSTLYKASASWIHKIQTTNTDIKKIIIVSK